MNWEWVVIQWVCISLWQSPKPKQRKFKDKLDFPVTFTKCLFDFTLEAWVWGLITWWPSKWNILLTWTSIRWNSSKQLHAPHEASPLRNLAKALYWKSSEQLNPTHCLATALAKSLTVSVFPVAVSPQTKPPCNDEKTTCYKWFKIQRKFRSLSYVCAAFVKEYVQSFKKKAHY